MVRPSKVFKALNKARIGFVVMHAQGLTGSRVLPQKVRQLGLLLVRKDHEKAVRVVQGMYPRMYVQHAITETRFKVPRTGDSRIKLIKPMDRVYQMYFRNSCWIRGSYRVPRLEMRLVSEFAIGFLSHEPQDPEIKRHAVNFADLVLQTKRKINMSKLGRLANRVCDGGGASVRKLVAEISSGRQIII